MLLASLFLNPNPIVEENLTATLGVVLLELNRMT